MQNNIPIFLASNDKYAPFVATTIASVCYNTKSFCNFYVLDSGISNLNKRRIELLKEKFTNFSVEYLKIDLSNFGGFKSADYISLDTYSRFFIPLLKPKLEKVIYMDVDMIALGDIQDLYNTNLDDYVLGAVPEEFEYKNKCKLNNKLENSKDHKYFNAGLLLINVQKWNQNDVTTKLLEVERKHKDKLTFADQCILNKYFNNNYKQLDVGFNIMIKYLQEHNFELPRNSVVRHFEGSLKPWLSNTDWEGYSISNFEDFWFFAKMTDFYEILKFKYFSNLLESKKEETIANNNSEIPALPDNQEATVLASVLFNQKIKLKLFNTILLLKMIKKNNKTYYKLFGFIPLLKVIKKDNGAYYKLFGFIPLLKIKKA